MNNAWADLNAEEIALINAVEKGSIYEGNWQFQLTGELEHVKQTRRQLKPQSAEEAQTAILNAIPNARKKLNFWRDRLKEELEEVSMARTQDGKPVLIGISPQSLDASQHEVAAVMASLKAKEAEFIAALNRLHDDAKLNALMQEWQNLSAEDTPAAYTQHIDPLHTLEESMFERLTEEDISLRDIPVAKPPLDPYAQLGLVAASKQEESKLPSENWINADTNEVPSIRAGLLRELYLGLIVHDGKRIVVPQSGIRIHNSKISASDHSSSKIMDLGHLGMSAGLPPLLLEGCYIAESPLLAGSAFQQISFQGSILPGIEATGIKIEGDVNLNRATLIQSKVLNFISARIGGMFVADWLSGSKDEEDERQPTMLFNFAEVRGIVRSRSGFGREGGDLTHRLTFKAQSAKFGSEVDFFNSPLKEFDLFLARIGSQVLLQRCNCEDDVLMSFATIGGYVDLIGLLAKNVIADNARVQGNFYLRSTPTHRTQIAESISLSGAEIDGDLDISGVSVESLNGYRLKVKGDLIASWIAGSAPGVIYVFECQKTLLLENAEIGGNLQLIGAALACDKASDALNAQLLRVSGNLSMGGFVDPATQALRLFTANGPISVMRSQINGYLAMQGGSLRLPKGFKEDAIDFSMSKIGSGVFFRASKFKDRTTISPGLEANAAITFIGAEIGTGFDADGASFEGSGKGPRGYVALDLRQTHISGVLRLGRADRWISENPPCFKSKGTVALGNAVIEAGIDCNYATFEELVPEDPVDANVGLVPVAAFDAKGAQINGDIRLGKREDGLPGQGFRAKGAVRLNDIKLEGNVILTGGSFVKGHKSDVALSLNNSRVDGDLIVKDLQDHPERRGEFDLRGASFSRIEDEAGKGWEAETSAEIKLLLDRCRYRMIAYDTKSCASRLAWFGKQFANPKKPKPEEYSPLSYEQAFNVLEVMGQFNQAKRVAIEQARTRRKCKVDNWWARRWSWLYDFTANYGHSASRASKVMAGWLFIGVVFTYLMISFGWIGRHTGTANGAAALTVTCDAYEAPVLALQALLPSLRRGGARDECELLPGEPHQYVNLGVEVPSRLVHMALAVAIFIYTIIGTALAALAILTWTGVLRRRHAA